MRALILFFAATTVAVVGLAGPAAAVTPARSTYTVSVNVELTGVCSFPLSIDVTATFTEIDFFDDAGRLVRIYAHASEQDVFSAHGISLRGDTYAFNLDLELQPDGTLAAAKTVGVAEKIPLPAGGFFLVAGYTDLLTVEAPFILTVTHGIDGDASALCLALTP